MRLPRPHIPLEVRCRVALRQLGEMWPDDVLAADQNRGKLLGLLLAQLAALLGCEPGGLHLDHDPALCLRDKIENDAGEIIGYVPDANDPEHLIYREKRAHQIKTTVHGIGAQRSDIAELKRARRRENGSPSRQRPKRKWAKRPFPKGRGFQKKEKRP
jgi:hypothetical protein